ncbi:YeiH family protein [Paenibacillus planticolens]|uniref:Sulfate exporter family transporter n=1 Tax=Paenibacillus planticolens TaxID=2654976 RepID=A0ABX1ZLP9_9BACL|nr:YeiH family protein [Paenibacillus planticolens]NOV00991.1 putative sulfate exporter family transporter [Paenibacillus planticolens]
MKWFRSYGPGLLLVLVLAAAAQWIGSLIPLIGGPVFGIVFGIILNHTYGKPANSLQGILFTSKKVLQWAIICLGAGLSLSQVWKTGLESLSVMLFSLTAAFLAAYGIGRLMGVPLKLQSLIGVGTAICGGSAIAAVSPILEAKEDEIAYSISTIFLFNVVAVLVFPALGHFLGLTQKGFGLWAGTAINDTSSVVAAGYIFGNDAGTYATIVKLTRTTMIIPISLLFTVIKAVNKKREAAESGKTSHFQFMTIFPWFIIWFLIASFLYTIGVIPAGIQPYIGDIGKFMIVMALTAIGLNADFRKMIQTGYKPILLGLIVWIVVAVVSLIVQYSTGNV